MTGPDKQQELGDLPPDPHQGDVALDRRFLP
jgi:hypothetical protein